MMPTLTAATDPVSGSPLSAPFERRWVDRVGQRDVRAGDRGGAGAAVGLEDVAVEDDGVLAERLVVDDRAQRAADQPADLVGAAADPALDRLAVGAGVGGGGEHRVLRGDPAQAGALAPARHALGGGGGAQHPGPAELDEHRAGGVVEPVAGDRDRAELVVGPAVAARAGRRGSRHGRDPSDRARAGPGLARGTAAAVPPGHGATSPRRAASATAPIASGMHEPDQSRDQQVGPLARR